MRKIILLFMLFVPMATNSAYINGVTPKKMFGSSYIQFGIDRSPNDVCDYFNRQFRFDAKTQEGKNMLSILMSAMLANKTIDIWYDPSTTPGTNKDNGCTGSTLATVKNIGFD